MKIPGQCITLELPLYIYPLQCVLCCKQRVITLTKLRNIINGYYGAPNPVKLSGLFSVNLKGNEY